MWGSFLSPSLRSFPTPTLLYRTARAIVEALGAWKFPDERPLEPQEVRSACSDLGEVVFEKTLWPLILTQHIIVVRKTLTPQDSGADI